MAQVIRKTKNKYPDLDLSKPVDVRTKLHEADPEDCFTYLWMTDQPLCNICSELEICGILYNARLAKQVKDKEKEQGVTYLDNMHFNEIVDVDVITWLRHKPRTGRQFIDMIEKFSGCSDRDTTKYWCAAFVKEHKNISIGADKIIKVK